MAKVRLEAISPIHIGSGIHYQGNAEYLYFERERVVVLIDEAKVLDIIGTDNIHIWVNFIERREGDFLAYLRQRKPDIKPEDVALRIIPLKTNRSLYHTNTLREQIHSALGPYLPGSSIKGAIRTAVFADSLMKTYKSKGIPEMKLGEWNKRTNRFTIDDKILQQEVFGNNPNEDWFRMLQVGDCYFSSVTHAAFAETLNEKEEARYTVKDDVRQLIEYIPMRTTGEFSLSIPQKHLELIQKHAPGLLKEASKGFNIKGLFKLIHQHSLRLLNSEIAFFEDADIPEAADGLWDFLQELKRDASTFAENECLLRLGFGTGYRAMTGNWVNDLVFDDDLFDEIATATRRTTRYNGMPLPKSRKIMFDGILMGYIKLTLQ